MFITMKNFLAWNVKCSKHVVTIRICHLCLCFVVHIFIQRHLKTTYRTTLLTAVPVTFVVFFITGMQCKSEIWHFRVSLDWVMSACSKLELPLIEVLQTTLWPLTFTYDLQSQANHGHDPYTNKSSRSKVTQLKRQTGNKLTDRWMEPTALLSVLTWSVISTF